MITAGCDPSSSGVYLCVTDGKQFIETSELLTPRAGVTWLRAFGVRMLIIERAQFMPGNEMAANFIRQTIRHASLLEAMVANYFPAFTMHGASIRSCCGCKVRNDLYVRDAAGNIMLAKKSGKPRKVSSDTQVKTWMETLHLASLGFTTTQLLKGGWPLGTNHQRDAYLGAFAGQCLLRSPKLQQKYSLVGLLPKPLSSTPDPTAASTT